MSEIATRDDEQWALVERIKKNDKKNTKSEKKEQKF